MSKRTSKEPVLNQAEMNDKWQTNELIFNALMQRSQVFSSLMDPRRNINDECGYPETSSISTQYYREMYDREGVAARVVEVIPMETWKVQPEVYEEEDMSVSTPFEEAWDELNLMLRQDSWYKGEEGSPIWEMLTRVDILSGIGSFGVLLLGYDDGLPLREPLVSRPGRKLLFMRVFDESLIQIGSYETDLVSPRYGMPLTYHLTFADPADVHSGMGQTNITQEVHWSRVLHVADNLGGSEIFGVPRMRPVFNRLLDLKKLYSGSAEMYWRGAFPGLSIETHPQLGGDVSIDADEVRDKMEAYMNGLQRYFGLAGMTAKSLAPQVVDPTPQINTQLEAICIKLGIPKRVFMGSERGELSSGQDADTWDDRLRARQRGYVTPRLIVPFVDRLIGAGVLPEPAESYCVDWPDLAQASEAEQSTTALARTQAMAAYVGGGVDVLIEPQNYLTKVIGFSDDEAEEILEATTTHIEDGGIQTPVDEQEEAMAALDLEEKEKNIAQIGKEQPNVAAKPKPKF